MATVRFKSELNRFLRHVRTKRTKYIRDRLYFLADELYDSSPVVTGLYRANHDVSRRGRQRVYAKNRNSRSRMKANIRQMLRSKRLPRKVIFGNNVPYAGFVERRHNVYNRAFRRLIARYGGK